MGPWRSITSDWMRAAALMAALMLVAAGCTTGQIESIAGDSAAPDSEVAEVVASSPAGTSPIETAEADIGTVAIEQTTTAPPLGTAPPPTTDAPPTLDEELDKGESSAASVRGDLSWETQAQLVFANGIDGQELDELWDGYPFAAEERAPRIEAFVEHFGWASGLPVLLELNQYFAFGEPSEFFEPIITIHSQSNVGRSAVFVGTWDGETLRIGRIPEIDDELTVIAADERSLIIEGVGVEGAPAAFYFAQRLEVVTDHDALITSIALPDNYVSGDPITVVFPTPELAAAGIVRSP